MKARARNAWTSSRLLTTGCSTRSVIATSGRQLATVTYSDPDARSAWIRLVLRACGLPTRDPLPAEGAADGARCPALVGGSRRPDPQPAQRRPAHAARPAGRL